MKNKQAKTNTEQNKNIYKTRQNQTQKTQKKHKNKQTTSNEIDIHFVDQLRSFICLFQIINLRFKPMH